MRRLCAMTAMLCLSACGSSSDSSGSPSDDAGNTNDAGDASSSPTDTGGGPGDAEGTDSAPGNDAVVTDSGAPSGDAGPVVPDTHPRIYLNATNLARLKGALTSKAAAAARFQSMVDSELGGADVYNYSAQYSALMYQLTGDAKYATDAITRVDTAVAAEEATIASGNIADVAGDDYLYVGPTIGDLALTYDWCFDKLTPSQKQRWLAYANQAVFNVWNPDGAQWGGKAFAWNGWSIDDPSDNYYYSFLTATMLLGLASKGESPQADTWLATFRTKKIGQELVPTFTSDLTGGGSREGTGYGSAMRTLFYLYDVWEASTGERLADLTTHTKSSLAYMMQATLPTLDRFAPIGDQSRDSTASFFDYQREYVEVLDTLYPSDPLAKVGRDFLAKCSVPKMGQGFEYVFDFIYDDTTAPTSPITTLGDAYYGSGTGHVFTRSTWAKDATWLSFIAGPYTESHAHEDQLSFMLFKNEWLAYDQNVSSHSGIRQEEEMHNLVAFAKGTTPVEQQQSKSPTKLSALTDDATLTYLSADATALYGAPIKAARRDVVFLKPGVVVVYDHVDTDDTGGAVSRTWLLNTPIAPTISGSTFAIVGTKSRINGFRVAPTTGSTITTKTWATSDTDMNAGYQLRISGPNGGPSDFLVVLSIDGAATAVVDASSTGKKAVKITMADASQKTVTFDVATVGVTVDSRVIAAGVNAPPLFAP